MILQKTLSFVGDGQLMSCNISFRMAIVLVSCLKYDPSQLLNQNTQKNVKILYYSVDKEKKFNPSQGRRTGWHP